MKVFSIKRETNYYRDKQLNDGYSDTWIYLLLFGFKVTVIHHYTMYYSYFLIKRLDYDKSDIGIYKWTYNFDNRKAIRFIDPFLFD